jgi:molybdenum cofactor cytidylyltransferase
MAHARQIDLRDGIFASCLKVTPEPSIAAVILSGGSSRRMGTPKALLQFQNETFLDRLIRLFSSVASPIIVVVGHHSNQIRAGIQRSEEVQFVVNPDPDRGMLTSLQCGLEAVPAPAEAVMFTPVDHPHIQSSTLQALAAHVRSNRAPVTIPTYAGAHGHPVSIARPVIEELLKLPETATAADVIHRYKNATCYVEVPDLAVIADIDDPDSYAELVATRLPPSTGHQP